MVCVKFECKEDLCVVSYLNLFELGPSIRRGGEIEWSRSAGRRVTQVGEIEWSRSELVIGIVASIDIGYSTA
ncbi:hypothetical protein KFK09_010623 [Dendrobium nobile]|uniref:Uncharacterized protein n=1 Tax=Dendrobium nobile TaxID=94219 RepID=A0A8T3BC99_DENNO|nr:hypothetical protein KFK09_010623 [Dendrobium nobile]